MSTLGNKVQREIHASRPRLTPTALHTALEAVRIKGQVERDRPPRGRSERQREKEKPCPQEQWGQLGFALLELHVCEKSKNYLNCEFLREHTESGGLPYEHVCAGATVHRGHDGELVGVIKRMSLVRS